MIEIKVQIIKELKKLYIVEEKSTKYYYILNPNSIFRYKIESIKGIADKNILLKNKKCCIENYKNNKYLQLNDFYTEFLANKLNTSKNVIINNIREIFNKYIYSNYDL